MLQWDRVIGEFEVFFPKRNYLLQANRTENRENEPEKWSCGLEKQNNELKEANMLCGVEESLFMLSNIHH